MAQLRRRVETLESQQKASDTDTQIDRLTSYGLRHETDLISTLLFPWWTPWLQTLSSTTILRHPC